MSTNVDAGPKPPADAPRPPVDIRYGQIGLVQLRIRSTDTGAILDELTGRIATAPNFFRRTAVCLDLNDLETAPDTEQIRGVVDAVRRAGMLSVGLAGSSPELDAIALALNIPVLSAFRPSTFPGAAEQIAQQEQAGRQDRAARRELAAKAGPSPRPSPAPGTTEVSPTASQAVSTSAPPAATQPAAAPAAAPAVEPALAAMMQLHTVRSGQRIYARNRDLIITAGVGAGAEVMADGCVHIYGSLRGRAMGGVHGQTHARVFCQEFHAELVSIAGVFRVFETIPADLAGKPVQAWLDGENLNFAVIGA